MLIPTLLYFIHFDSIASFSGADDIVSLGVLSDTFKDGNSRMQGHEAVLGQVGRVQDRERYGVQDEAPRNERIRLYQETERPRREGNDILTPRPPGSRLA